MTRKQVYELIDSERDYQNQVEHDPERCTQEERLHSQGEYYCMLMKYVNRFPEVWSTLPDDHDDVKAMWRVIAGIAVHCMEDYGAPFRSL